MDVTAGGWQRVSIVVAIVVGVLIGAVLTPVVFGVTDGGGDDPPVVAVVPVEGSIDGGSAAQLTATVERIRQNPDVEAVVLVVNSPGGSAAASESQYLAVDRLADEMPVVASVNAVGASGAYYTVLPSDRIYVKPASIVGSVGVLAPLPRQLEPNNVVAASGPNKLATDSQRQFLYTIETLQNAFVNAVMAHRGDELSLTRAEVAEAGVFSGAVAVRNGVADAIGDETTAIAYAAEQAGLEEYAVEVYRPNGTTQFISRAAYVASDAPDREMVDPAYLTGVGATGTTAANYLMLPPQFAYAGTSAERAYLGAGAYENATAPAPSSGADGEVSDGT